MSEPLVDVTGARRERERRRLIRRLKVSGLVVGLLVVVTGVVWTFTASSLFAVQEVHIEGLELADRESVEAAAAIEVGTPLAQVDAVGAAQRIVSLPEVAEVDVIRSWPKAVTIQVQERQPRIAVPDGSRYGLVDASGVSFAVVSKVPKGVPVASVPSSDPVLLRAVAQVVDLLPEKVRAQTTLLKAGSVDSITLEMSKNRTVIWGGVEDSELKAAALVPLLTTKARTYDVSAPTHPIGRR